MSQLAQTMGLGGGGYIVEFDMNKDVKISSIDLSFAAQRWRLLNQRKGRDI